ncbi:hypothetical protein PAJ34TS1_33990 [Paenibacillus azoreducens]|uniref:Uncharacterized protein n=1 Tax=Paenibacillus azoreducens TaxID=116718 RepID=A0A919YG55_9BACL|nr:hypothetical protein J34TS1_34580 [Paenibacillus azoreducens]
MDGSPSYRSCQNNQDLIQRENRNFFTLQSCPYFTSQKKKPSGGLFKYAHLICE